MKGAQSMSSLLVCHFLSSRFQLHLVVLSSVVYQLACLVDLLSLAGLTGVTVGAIGDPDGEFLTACSRLLWYHGGIC